MTEINKPTQIPMPGSEEFCWPIAGSASEELQRLLEKIYATDKAGRPRKAMDYVVDYIDDLLNAGAFDACREILAIANPDELSDPLIVSFLGITLGAKQRLQPERGDFYRRASTAVAKRRGIDAAGRLLEKYL
jgi:hypothetical protein